MDKVPQGKESLCVRKGNQPKAKDKDFTPEAQENSFLDRGTRGKQVQPGRVKWKKISNVV
jgi:hypothetical protein